MAALTPPVFHPSVVILLGDEVLHEAHDAWWKVGFDARHGGDVRQAAFSAAISDHIYQASFLLRGFVPGLVLDRETRKPKAVRLPHPDDLLYPAPDVGLPIWDGWA